MNPRYFRLTFQCTADSIEIPVEEVRVWSDGVITLRGTCPACHQERERKYDVVEMCFAFSATADSTTG